MSKLEVGQPAPDFRLESSSGDMVSLNDYRGQKIVLYFYPKDSTPGCTTEACDFRDNYISFKDKNTVILGISPDPIASHQKFITKHDLPFPLLADTDHQVCELYGVWKEKSMYGKKYWGVERTTFIIDENGNIEKIYPKVKVKGHVEAVLSEV